MGDQCSKAAGEGAQDQRARLRAAQFAHPKVGASWETFCLEQLITHARLADPASEAYFYRTQAELELDLVLMLRGEPVGIEVKLGITPRPTTSMELAMKDLGMKRAFQVNNSDALDALRPGVFVGGLVPVMEVLKLKPVGGRQ